MTKQEALTLINNMKAGKKYFWNKGSSKEGIAFELFCIENDQHFICEGFHSFDFNDERLINQRPISQNEFEGKLLTKSFGSRLLWKK